MWFRSMFYGLKGTSSPRRVTRQRPVSRRLAVEALEDRAVPASLWVGEATVTEANDGTRYAEVTVTLSEPSNRTVTVNYGTADATATTADNDYLAVSGKLTFAPGETSKSVRVAVIGDRIGEPNEYFFVNLHGAKNAKIVERQGIVNILDDEPRISISNGVEAAGPSGTTLWTFSMNLSVASDQEVTVNYATADGTAVASVDYLATSGTLTFAPGETIKSITVQYFGAYEAYFYVNLSGASTNAWFDFVPQGVGGHVPAEPCVNCNTEGPWDPYPVAP